MVRSYCPVYGAPHAPKLESKAGVKFILLYLFGVTRPDFEVAKTSDFRTKSTISIL
jgi:hypothetical protein